MSETTNKAAKAANTNDWSEVFINTPRAVKIKGDWVALGRDKMKLANGKEIEGPKNQAEFDLVKKKFPKAFKDGVKGRKRFGL